MRSIGVGFSFAGKHCDDMHCELANNDESMHSFMENFTVVSENVDGYDGGYYIGETVKEKEFNIKLLVEDAGDDVLAGIGQWMKRGAYGKLIFDHAPFKYYNARVTAPMDLSTLYTKYDYDRDMFTYSGTIGIKLVAYIPYAYLLDEVKENYPNVGNMKNTLDAVSEMMPVAERPYSSILGKGTLRIPNLGNAPAKPIITAYGMFRSGMIIKNLTTGQEMVLKDPYEDVEYTYCKTDSQMGITYTRKAKEDPWEVNDAAKTGSFITLVPAFPAKEISYRVAGGRLISEDADKDMEGKYVRILVGGKYEWVKILRVSGEEMVMDAVPDSASGTSKVILMNEITAEYTGEDYLLSLKVEHEDTFY